jgi:hypothetical protein
MVERLIITQASVDATLDIWFGGGFWREQCDSEVMRRHMRRTLDAAIDAGRLEKNDQEGNNNELHTRVE